MYQVRFQGYFSKEWLPLKNFEDKKTATSYAKSLNKWEKERIDLYPTSYKVVKI